MKGCYVCVCEEGGGGGVKGCYVCVRRGVVEG